jgi:hypothetical protein
MTLSFQVTGVKVERFAAVPTLAFDVEISGASAPVESLSLRCQIRIEPHRRRYAPEEEDRLLEVFGESPRWGVTLKPFLWTHLTALVPGFEGRTTATVPVACSYDLEVAAGKYLPGLSRRARTA